MRSKIAATVTAATVVASPIAVEAPGLAAAAPAGAAGVSAPVHVLAQHSTSHRASSKARAKRYAKAQVRKRGWSSRQYRCLVRLWERESSWNVYADNPTSSAYGIPQALPGRKMRSAGRDWRTNPRTQIRWGLRYIKGRYGSPCSALHHSDVHNWY